MDHDANNWHSGTAALAPRIGGNVYSLSPSWGNLSLIANDRAFVARLSNQTGYVAHYTVSLFHRDCGCTAMSCQETENGQA